MSLCMQIYSAVECLSNKRKFFKTIIHAGSFVHFWITQAENTIIIQMDCLNVCDDATLVASSAHLILPFVTLHNNWPSYDDKKALGIMAQTQIKSRRQTFLWIKYTYITLTCQWFIIGACSEFSFLQVAFRSTDSCKSVQKIGERTWPTELLQTPHIRVYCSCFLMCATYHS